MRTIHLPFCCLGPRKVVANSASFMRWRHEDASHENQKKVLDFPSNIEIWVFA